MTLLERDREQREEGRKEGTKEGIELAKKIFKLNSVGCSIDKIAEECNISVLKVREILE